MFEVVFWLPEISEKLFSRTWIFFSPKLFDENSALYSELEPLNPAIVPPFTVIFPSSKFDVSSLEIKSKEMLLILVVSPLLISVELIEIVGLVIS